jgi:kynurenine formamidase
MISVSSYANQILDLTHPFGKDTIYWPTEKGFALKTVSYGINNNGYFYSAFKFCAPEHGGTHVDAPRHFSEHGLTVDQIPVTQLMGNAVVIHVDQDVKDNSYYEIPKKAIINFEKQNRPLTSDDIVLFYTGWGKYWDDKKHYMGSDKLGDTKNLHFPGLSKEAAEYLVSKKVKGVGLDTASLDRGNSQESWAHRVLLGSNIYGIENIANLDKVPVLGATLIVAPLKIAGGSGAPTRLYALVN